MISGAREAGHRVSQKHQGQACGLALSFDAVRRTGRSYIMLPASAERIGSRWYSAAVYSGDRSPRPLS